MRRIVGAPWAYLAELDLPRTVLWCYLLWYLVVAIRYFDPSPELWGASLGVSGIIGVALLLNAGWPANSARLTRILLHPRCPPTHSHPKITGRSSSSRSRSPRTTTKNAATPRIVALASFGNAGSSTGSGSISPRCHRAKS